jgi:hypothetical protein
VSAKKYTYRSRILIPLSLSFFFAIFCACFPPNLYGFQSQKCAHLPAPPPSAHFSLRPSPPRIAAHGMSSRFSGIAVAAACRRARDGVGLQPEADTAGSIPAATRELSTKEQAVLASLKAQLLGSSGGGGEQAKAKSKPKVRTAAATAAIEAAEAKRGPHWRDQVNVGVAKEKAEEEEGDADDMQEGEEPSAPAEKVYLSKAARKKLKKQHKGGGEAAGAAGAAAARVPVSGGGVAKKKTKTTTVVAAEVGPQLMGPAPAGHPKKKTKKKGDKAPPAKKKPDWPPSKKTTR